MELTDQELQTVVYGLQTRLYTHPKETGPVLDKVVAEQAKRAGCCTCGEAYGTRMPTATKCKYCTG